MEKQLTTEGLLTIQRRRARVGAFVLATSIFFAILCFAYAVIQTKEAHIQADRARQFENTAMEQRQQSLNQAEQMRKHLEAIEFEKSQLEKQLKACQGK